MFQTMATMKEILELGTEDAIRAHARQYVKLNGNL